MNKELKRVSAVVLLMFVALFGSSTVISALEADSLRVDPRNTRTILASYSTERGPILVDGVAVAESVPIDDEFRFLRTYSQPELYSAVTGYFTLNQGDSGVEGALNDALSGTANDQFFAQLNAVITGQDPKGASVELTIDPVVQQAAWDALGDNTGSVVAIDPSTGAILAMVSKEAYDPNLLAQHDSQAVIDSYNALIEDPNRPLLNRAIGGDLYAPGSVFKLVVAAAAIDSGQYTADSQFPNPPTLQLPQSSDSISNAEGGNCTGADTVSLADALRLSCNIPFAQLGGALGKETIAEYTERFGFETPLEIPQTVTESVFPETDMDEPTLYISSFGQGSVRTTPLQVAMVSAAIANQGTLMTPTLVESITAPNLEVIEPFQEDVLSEPISEETAGTMTELMVANVNNGAASNARINGVDVAGKTGTAQNDGRDNTLWFTGFAPAQNPEIAVAVVVENGQGFGNSVAAPIARTVMEAVLNK
ncbi:peptidoglycan D,D-transpeptidase FtsI family protein [Marisediminicola senii]|uniref:peptidoglycan D,D-transpeptidase FtsI family protein n=1 Tax=Marisediminicola senii TaxID=2711233 RepID=UPI0013ECFCD9|nr:penicillin-binding transpeptidase domain-containing protein [Marisediminicola senii]